MSERKSINKYYPPDWDPNLVVKKKKKSLIIKVRLMTPYSMKCLKCNEYIPQRRSFNAKKEITNEKYLNIKIIRFYISCPKCSNSITFKTDPKTSGFVPENGANYNYDSKKKKNEDLTTKEETEEDLINRLEKEDQKDKLFQNLKKRKKMDLLFNDSMFEKKKIYDESDFKKRLKEQEKKNQLKKELEQLQNFKEEFECVEKFEYVYKEKIEKLKNEEKIKQIKIENEEDDIAAKNAFKKKLMKNKVLNLNLIKLSNPVLHEEVVHDQNVKIEKKIIEKPKLKNETIILNDDLNNEKEKKNCLPIGYYSSEED